MSDTKILVTGASGQLGKLVVAELATKVAKDQIAVLVRKDSDAETFTAEGYDVRRGDYNDVDAMTVAFAGVDRLLLISGSDIGQRVPQHTNVITAAQAAGVGYIAYTSLLRADENPMILAGEHKATEEVIKASGLSYTLLRNGWYSENSTAALPQILAMGQHFGAAGEGQFSSATRADYAAAAATVLATDGHEGKTYELGGDQAFTYADFVAAIGEVTGKEIAYVDMPQEAFTEALIGAGLPDAFAGVLAESDAQAGNGWLYTASNDLSTLIGRPTTPIKDVIADAVAAA